MRDILSKTVTFVLAGGRGVRLAPLTDSRSKPAVPFGDRRIIDFVLINSLKSNLTHPYVLTQYQATHLTQHVGRWWLQQSALGQDPEAAPVCVPPPKKEYKGTAAALLQNLNLIHREAQHVLILSADHIYDMDYRELLRFHVNSGCDATLASINYPSESSSQFGILEVGASDDLRGFKEKPQVPKELPGQPGRVLANMGIYAFKKEVLVDALQRDAADPCSSNDMGRNVIPNLVGRANIRAFQFQDPSTREPRYWKDVGTIDAYYEASMEWLDRLPVQHRLAGSRSVIADGVRIHRTAEVIDSILMPGVVVGPNARIHRAILDENVHVQRDAVVEFGAGGLPASRQTAKGVLVLTANSVVPARERRVLPKLVGMERQRLVTS